jgi:hypothetical protein
MPNPERRNPETERTECRILEPRMGLNAEFPNQNCMDLMTKSQMPHCSECRTVLNAEFLNAEVMNAETGHNAKS